MRTRLGLACLLLLVGSGITGCGIRATSVPVDAGPAPSRVSCDSPPEDGGAQPSDGVRVEVQLVCGSQLVAVKRVVPLAENKPGSTSATVAQELLGELERVPSSAERDAGFSTEVPETLTVAAGRRPGDPKETLRLSRRPEDLPPLALAQIVCTLAGSEAIAADGPVVLGGPDEDPPREWECTESLRARPEAVPTLGEVVRPTPS
ncbi:hypothetical protein NLX86_12830 [Streptomyces sp. A3M-1-3]|uniref:hypothetical protein n=1 Tax=Streptomyces sp. A3M-1-3 TaxID=2962044 RepID=UPI0020B7F280|nr:hypothetical protein [Streptomyces sp. A3M-1-3]MCP3818965.1 hypothetical protein [Streptomyces sp. A3M-1-3]